MRHFNQIFARIGAEFAAADAQPAPKSIWSSIPDRFRRRLSKGAYQAEIDGLRFIAIAIVVVGHFTERAQRFFPRLAEMGDNPFVSLLARPGLGVYLFFAISGFILATQVMKAKDGSLTGAFLRAYFTRRVLRIEPPYLILLFATWAALSISGYAPDKVNHFAVKPDSLNLSLATSIFYAHDLVWGAFPRLFPPGWSLEIEVQFYLLAPLLFFAYFGLHSRKARLALGLATLFAGVFSSLYSPRHIGALSVDYSILRFFHFFWLGIMLADLRPALTEWTRKISPLTLDLAGTAALLIFLVGPNGPEAPATFADLGLALLIHAISLASVTIIFASAFAPSRFQRFCAHPWISLIGGACYSIYLTHLQAIQVMTSLIARRASGSPVTAVALYGVAECLAIIAIGLVFYAAIERSFMIPQWPTKLARWIVGRPAGGANRAASTIQAREACSPAASASRAA